MKILKKIIEKAKAKAKIKEDAEKYINDYINRQKQLYNKIEELKKLLREETKGLYLGYDKSLLDDGIHPKLISIVEYLSKLVNQIELTIPWQSRDFDNLEEILDIIISHKDFNLEIDDRNRQRSKWLAEWQKELGKKEIELEEREEKIKEFRMY